MTDLMQTLTTDGQLLTAPQHQTSLATAAILVNVSISVWTGTKSDNAIADRVSHDAGAKQRVGRFSHDLLANDPDLKQVLNHRQTVANWLSRYTYAWAGSLRLLPIVRLPKFMEEYKNLQDQFDTLLENFLSKYDGKVSDQAFVRGDLFDRADYPTVEQLRGRFSMQMYTCEIPTNDFRVAIAADIAEDLRRNYERQTRDLIGQIVNEQKDQIITLLKSLSHACTVEIETADGDTKVRRRKIYNSTFTRAIEICDTFAEFNPGGDPELQELRDEFWKIVHNIDADRLRESDSQRDQVKQQVDSLLSRFAA